MPDFLQYEHIRKELRGILLTLAMVAAVTLAVYWAVAEIGLEHGSVLYLVPVLIAATRWGVVAAIAAAFGGVLASAFFFYPPLYSFRIRDPQEVLNLVLFMMVAIGGQPTRQPMQPATGACAPARERHARPLRLLAPAGGGLRRRRHLCRDRGASRQPGAAQGRAVRAARATATASGGRHAGLTVPPHVLAEVAEAASGRRDLATGARSPPTAATSGWSAASRRRTPDFGVIAIDLGSVPQERSTRSAQRVDDVLSDAAATLERLDVARALNEAKMRSETELLREALIGSVSHELRTPLASILGAATVLSKSPAIASDERLSALASVVRDEAERLNNDIQNLLDATRISRERIRPRHGMDRAGRHRQFGARAPPAPARRPQCRARYGLEPAAHLCRSRPGRAGIRADRRQRGEIFARRLAHHRRGASATATTSCSRSHDQGAGLTAEEQRAARRAFLPRRRATRPPPRGSGLGLWIAKAFVAANGGKIQAASAGADQGTDGVDRSAR